MLRPPALLPPLALLGAACACTLADAPAALRTRSAPVVYGADDRVEVVSHPSARLREAASSVGALVERSDLDIRADGTVVLDVPTIGQMQGLCEGEPFADQPALAQCSATLIADDLVLTAGHCMPDGLACRDRLLVFGYQLDAGGVLAEIRSDDVFACAEIVAARNGRRANLNLDFAVFRIDRPAPPRHTPAPLRLPAAPLAVGEPIALVGFPSGAPMKVDTGGEVLDDRDRARDFFSLTADAFNGSSGGAVFDSAGRVVGVLVRGRTDYVPRNGCSVVNVIDDVSDGAEEATYVEWPIDALCAEDDSAAVCALRPPCPEGACLTSPPNDWRCAPELFDDGYGCDCECGAYDPDCEDALLPVFDCPVGEVCSFDGVCVTDRGAPEDWICNPIAWSDGACDCGCGDDPDCDQSADQARNCLAGEVCIDGAECRIPSSKRRTCAIGPGSSPPFTAALALFALVLSRLDRRRQS